MLPLNKKQPHSWRDALKFVGSCPVCHREYDPEAARLFAKNNNANMVHINCGHCKSAMMFMIMVLGQGLSSVGMLTDLSFDDARKLYGAEAMTLDEVLEGYQFINNNQFLSKLI